MDLKKITNCHISLLYFHDKIPKIGCLEHRSFSLVVSDLDQGVGRKGFIVKLLSRQSLPLYSMLTPPHRGEGARSLMSLPVGPKGLI